MNIRFYWKLIFGLGVCSLFVSCSAPVITKTIRIDRHSKPSSQFYSPLKNAKLLSPFGPRGKSYHTGVDLKSTDSVRALAARDGVVAKTGWVRGYGQIVEIKHSDRFITRYAHLKKILVKKNQKLKAGQDLGIVGATGRATTPHLHFEILTSEGYFTDPCQFISCRKKK